MNNRSYLGIIGAVLVIAGGLSPMLRLPIVGNWNYFDLDTYLASIVFIFAALGLIAAVLKKHRLLRFCGGAVLALVILTLVAVFLKVNDAFSFIPLKKLASVAAGVVRYKWLAWILLFVGALLMLIGSKQEVSLKKV